MIGYAWLDCGSFLVPRPPRLRFIMSGFAFQVWIGSIGFIVRTERDYIGRQFSRNQGGRKTVARDLGFEASDELRVVRYESKSVRRAVAINDKGDAHLGELRVAADLLHNTLT